MKDDNENESKPLTLDIDRESMRKVLAEQLSAVANQTIKNTLVREGLDKQIETAARDALQARIMGRNTFQENLSSAYDNAIWQAMNKAVAESGIQEMAGKIITEYISTDEFADQIKECAIETVKRTSYFIKLEQTDQS